MTTILGITAADPDPGSRGCRKSEGDSWFMRWLMALPCFFLIGVACGGNDSSGATNPNSEVNMDSITTPSGLQYKDLVVGTGEEARASATAVVHYNGWLLDGTKFDSSVDRGTPFEFLIGRGRVIQGWDEGVASMSVGGKRELIIPPDLAYGDRGAGGVIPPGATLRFEVELLDLK